MRLQWRLLRHYRHRHRPNILPPPPSSPFLSLPESAAKPTSFHHCCFYSSTSDSSPSTNASSFPNTVGNLAWIFTSPDHRIPKKKDHLIRKVKVLRDKLVETYDGAASAYELLEEMGSPLFDSYDDGSALIELLSQLYDFPSLAVEVFNWRRRNDGLRCPITSEEYAKGIMVAGRARDVELAVELFTEAVNNNAKTSSTYNALMSVYMTNGLPDKCQSLFREFKMEECCSATIVTYNILISVFGRLMLIYHMEATLQEIYDSGLCPNVVTYNNLIAGYVTAWMWDRMENTYLVMKDRGIDPDNNTYMLMLRGYSHSGNLKMMEEMYELVKQHLDLDNVNLIRAMISAYCKGSGKNRVERIDELIRLVPEQEYRPWLNVLLIKVYAEEQLLERMDKFINVAFEKNIAVNSVRVMRKIITAYYHSNAVDKLTHFVKRSECAGWRVCRSLYHCKMVMYGSQNLMEEMENVLAEMEKSKIDPTVKTWSIMIQAYRTWGPRCKLDQVKGLMCKYGYGIS
ncbi:pentatricopeptide repeat-containing protein At2g30780 [Spinacia oleracea]|uniref:Pentatricopeptide repeat-containing protein At2g30780 n=1 Tax=Spinacia oleracea TaxID=3562 RepID=A0ABM3QVF1_SPIOL|nr:pentatricopeptide repeat-containing protein At2g30780 [Spinacia oleracea]XP_056687347.1 pentatricopeptide repeat-containing protein At2g30780 [Spinacia oleracea]XP_056687348.1 pentatricopeptide repeat-containing protein At2g30780 [Spinacia oleracea]